MKCPYCGNLNSRVVDSRLTPGDFSVRRRRECQFCFRRFTTFEKVEQIPVVIVKKDGRREEFSREKVEQIPVVIVKKDGRREEFSREKVLSGLKKACEKRAISVEQLEAGVDSIERDFREKSEKEVSSRVVGEKIMSFLYNLDDVAYVRFASVYREFKDVADFIDELKTLGTEKKKAVIIRDTGMEEQGNGAKKS